LYPKTASTANSTKNFSIREENKKVNIEYARDTQKNGYSGGRLSVYQSDFKANNINVSKRIYQHNIPRNGYEHRRYGKNLGILQE
jgi:hypothetical protein